MPIGISTSASSDSDWAYIQDKGKLTVGITLFAPMNYYNEKNKLVGFDTEMAEAVTKKLGIDVGIGDIVGGRDYLTGMYGAKPIENITCSVIAGVTSKEYELEGENDDGDS